MKKHTIDRHKADLDAGVFTPGYICANEALGWCLLAAALTIWISFLNWVGDISLIFKAVLIYAAVIFTILVYVWWNNHRCITYKVSTSDISVWHCGKLLFCIPWIQINNICVNGYVSSGAGVSVYIYMVYLFCGDEQPEDLWRWTILLKCLKYMPIRKKNLDEKTIFWIFSSLEQADAEEVRDYLIQIWEEAKK